VNREGEAAELSLQRPLTRFHWNVKEAIEIAAIPPLPSPLPQKMGKAKIALMREHLTGKFTELIFNFGKVGSSDWEDWKLRKAIACRALAVDDVYCRVSIGSHHVTLLACPSAGGDAPTPMIVSQSPISDSLWNHD
jgi:hypothetical protein